MEFEGRSSDSGCVDSIAFAENEELGFGEFAEMRSCGFGELVNEELGAHSESDFSLCR